MNVYATTGAHWMLASLGQGRRSKAILHVSTNRDHPDIAAGVDGDATATAVPSLKLTD